MGRWLLKTEPTDYGFADLEREGTTVWDGVRNRLALRHVRDVRRGDEALVYHSGRERAVVGLARVISDPYPDPEAKDPKLAVFDLRAGRRLPRAVPLSDVKADPAFRDFDLVRLPRLSVMPVPPELWERLLEKAGT